MVSVTKTLPWSKPLMIQYPLEPRTLFKFYIIVFFFEFYYLIFVFWLAFKVRMTGHKTMLKLMKQMLPTVL